MATISKFYFHNATSTDTGTLPGASDGSTSTPGVTAAGAATNRTMDDVIGTAQVSQALTTLAQTAGQANWFRRFVSAPLAAQTIGLTGIGSWSIHLGMSESNTSSSLSISAGVCYLWRPSTGALVGKLWDEAGFGGSGPSTTSETALSNGLPINGTTTAQTAQAGDVLVYELWSLNVQGMATAYTNTVFYDGTTEDSATSNAAYLLAPSPLTMLGAAAALQPKPQVVSQAVQRAATRCWKRRRSGIVVPRLWTPEAA